MIDQLHASRVIRQRISWLAASTTGWGKFQPGRR